ncbi:hypothetical protein EYC80_001306 [Monilinia laxa]|uniref:Uncharacterized protein n=1 Tax=Monilinia laxa TaxID=61186 RepID=A0A5N6K9S4_MONLA|nr:hypothetical protein EYC80_001306 [Monilinia laxa]
MDVYLYIYILISSYTYILPSSHPSILQNPPSPFPNHTSIHVQKTMIQINTMIICNFHTFAYLPTYLPTYLPHHVIHFIRLISSYIKSQSI